MLKQYGGKFLGSFFASNSGDTYGQSGSRSHNQSGSRWKQDSIPLGSIDQGVASNEEISDKGPRRSDDDIVVTSSFTVTQAAAGDDTSARGKEFDTESQEDIIKRVKKYSN